MRPGPRYGNGHDVDPVAVDRLCAGDAPSRVLRSELQEAIVRLEALGLSNRAIARRVGCTWRTVQRLRAARNVQRRSAA